MATTRPSYTKLTCLLLLLLQEQGDFLLASTPTGHEEPYDMRETLFVRSPNRMEEAQVVPLLSTLTHLHVNPKGRQAYSLLIQTTMEPLPHGLWSCSSKPLTGRTGHRLRDASVYWNHRRYTLDRNLPLPDKDSSYVDDMPCRHPLH